MTSLTETLRQSYAPSVPFEVEVPEVTIPKVLENAAAFYPDRPAVDFLGNAFSYHELEDRALRAASVFRRAGVKRGDRVAFVMPNCPQHLIAFYGVLQLGGIVAEHNPLAPASQLEAQFKNHGAKVAVIWEKCFDDLAPIAARLKIKLITVDLTAAMNPIAHFAVNLPFKFVQRQREKLRPLEPVPNSVPKFEELMRVADPYEGACPAVPEDTAVLLHTGGTTGTPKAVELTHRNLVANTAMSAAWVPQLHEGAEVFAATLPFFHAFGMTLSLLAAVRMAATIMIFPAFDVDLIIAGQKRRPITFFPGVAPMFKRLYKAAIEKRVDFSSVRFSLSGAMPLNDQIARDWEDLTAGYIIEGYGMTEASPILLGNPVSHLRRPGTLGVPFPSTEVKIVDVEDPSVEVPEGEKGEIICRGPQVFKGYWNNPEETEACMYGDWIRTGDIGRVDQGMIVMADRKKELIITGGFNVYPSQVEEAVRTMPGIEEVAVVGVPDASSGERIVAAIVASGEASIDLEQVRAWAEKTLSHYALPKQITFMTELPRSQVGKVLRRSVREQLLNASESAQAGLQSAGAQLASLTESAGQTLRTLSEQAKQLTGQVMPGNSSGGAKVVDGGLEVVETVEGTVDGSEA
ncbi:long-chain fatty acid--CoA ligase [Boudabousia liubingyangii]|uniref:Long-chain fatty acid--CoA ligase n=1 Tax=Boudabousia liubingyangii TaxID=1921764 RepID=A0A1Q5PNC4_9ACTO|nr:AMP-binding protein [Boudabousia liubingyangii]OKL47531.1 long-chain fatty acid--CoA ligase [Boudabousia liubingyangii]OKL48955.1 long-chain fatty acid--CoA ligase [Boudabousia liubingyangii]